MRTRRRWFCCHPHQRLDTSTGVYRSLICLTSDFASSMRLTSMESRIFFAKFITQKFLPSHPSRMGTCGDLEAVRRPFYQPRRWFFAFKPFYRCMGRWESSLSRKSMYYSLIWLVQSMLQLVAVDFPPPIGAIGSDCDREQILSRNLLALSPTCTYWDVGNWLVV